MRNETMTEGDRTAANIAKLPERCAATLPTDGSTILIRRGESGYYPGPVNTSADELNRRLGVTPAQAEAMFNGSMFGWGTRAADPDFWAEKLETV